MDKITSLLQYKDLISENKKRFGALDKNCFLLPSGMEDFIREGRLYAHHDESGLYILIDEDSFFRMFYHVPKGGRIVLPPAGKPVLTEEIDQNDSREAYIAEISGRFERAGMRFYRKSWQYQIPLDPEDSGLVRAARAAEELLVSNGLTLQNHPDGKQAEEILSLWESRLDFGDIPGCDLSFDMNGTRDMIFATDASGRVIATYLWETRGKDSSEGRHIVTAPDHLRRGIAGAMLACGLLRIRENGVRRHFTWIHEDNISSVRLHEKAGFERISRSSVQYISVPEREVSQWNRS